MGSEAPAYETPLLIAARRGHDEIIKLLVDHGADIGAKNYEGVSPFHEAMGRSVERETLEYMLQRGKQFDVNPRTPPTQPPPLSLAAWRGFRGIAEELIRRGAKVNALNSFTGNTALHYAAMKGNRELAVLLLARGADPSIKNRGGRTAFDEAEKAGNAEVAKILRDAMTQKPENRSRP